MISARHSLRPRLAPALIAALLVTGALPAQAQQAEPATPRNVILMIADGQGFNGWLATDYYTHGRAGAEPYMQARPGGVRPYVGAMATGSLEAFDEAGQPNRDPASIRTVRRMGYDPLTRWTDFGVVRAATDSAAASTVLHTGRRTTNGRLGMSWDGDSTFRSIAAIAREEGMATGAVTSVQFAHATPAGVAVQSAARSAYADIAQQMLDGRLDVVMGAGHPLRDDDGRTVAADAVPAEAWEWAGGRAYFERVRAEGRTAGGLSYVEDRAGFEALARSAEGAPERVFGLAPVRRTLQMHRAEGEGADTASGSPMVETSPALDVMARGALNLLDRNPNGFFVMIEGGAVDWANEANLRERMIEEHSAFNRAVAAVVEWVETHSSWEETLLIVTADHESGMIWGPGAWTDVNGDRKWDAGDRFNGFELPVNRGEGQLPDLLYGSGGHTSELVPLFALGAGAERFRETELRDQGAARLWGAAYGWSGGYVDNTAVFDVMRATLEGAEKTNRR